MNVIVVLFIGITIFVSWKGWNDPVFFNRLKFDMYAILNRREYDRILTSGFLHADTMHLMFNMFALYMFAPVVLSLFSGKSFVFIYIASILLGNLFTVLFHRNQIWYTAVGASGGVSGIVFSAIMIEPELPLKLIFLPFFDFPGWAFGLAYLAYSMFGMRNLNDNIGHAAHLGGSVSGMILTILLFPFLIKEHSVYILGMLIPIILMGFVAWKGHES